MDIGAINANASNIHYTTYQFWTLLLDFVKRLSAKQLMIIHMKIQMEDFSMRLDKEISMHKGGSLNMRDPSNINYTTHQSSDKSFV